MASLVRPAVSGIAHRGILGDALGGERLVVRVRNLGDAQGVMQFESGDVQIFQRGKFHLGARVDLVSMRIQFGFNLVVVDAQARFFRRPGRQSHAKQQKYKASPEGRGGSAYSSKESPERQSLFYDEDFDAKDAGGTRVKAFPEILTAKFAKKGPPKDAEQSKMDGNGFAFRPSRSLRRTSVKGIARAEMIRGCRATICSTGS